MSTVDDWLALQRLVNQDLTDWLKACERTTDVVGLEGSEDGRRKHGHHVQAAAYLAATRIAWLCRKPCPASFSLHVGRALDQLRHALARSQCGPLYTDAQGRSYARWDDRTREVDVRLHHVNGCVKPLTVAHEFVHVLQALQAQACSTPPVLRETGAFLGELALMGFEAGLPASTRRQYRRIWRQENQYYFGVAGHLLAAGLAQPNQAYRYAINYPLARAAALWAAQDWAGSIAWRRA